MLQRFGALGGIDLQQITQKTVDAGSRVAADGSLGGVEKFRKVPRLHAKLLLGTIAVFSESLVGDHGPHRHLLKKALDAGIRGCGRVGSLGHLLEIGIDGRFDGAVRNFFCQPKLPCDLILVEFPELGDAWWPQTEEVEDVGEVAIFRDVGKGGRCF